MSLRRTNISSIVCACFLIVFAACERNITQVVEDTTPASCFGCHNDADALGLVAAEAQWSYSVHASGANIDRNRTTSSRYAACEPCHTSEGFVAKVTGTPADMSSVTAIHCFTCHAPHSNGNFDLRITEDNPQVLQNGVVYDLADANICVACHQSRQGVDTYVTGEVELEERWGPHHGPQGDLLIGTNGYEYEGFDYRQTNHKAVAENGCLDCHFKYTQNYVLGGHSFNVAYEMESEGSLEEVELTAGCNASSCHDGAVEDFNVVFQSGSGIQDTVSVLLEDLHTRLVAAGLLDDESGLPLEVVTSADSAGAVWNYLMVEEDRSHGVHNAKYIVDLLTSSIEYMTAGPVNSPPAEGTAVSRR